MFGIDTATATGLLPAFPAAGTEKFFQDTDGGGGTIIPAWWLNMIQEEGRALVVAAGLTPDKADVTQWAQAVALLASAAATAVTSQYLNVRDEKASGTDGGTFTSGAWRTRTLNTVKTNEISGASLSGNEITLPAGTYRIVAKASAHRVKDNKIKLYNVTDGADVLIGMNAFCQGGDGDGSIAPLNGQFTLDAQKNLSLMHRCKDTRNTIGFGYASTFGVVEVYADVEIWKLA